MWYKNSTGRFFGLVTKHAGDRQMDGQNYDSQDRTTRGSNPKSCVMEYLYVIYEHNIHDLSQ